MTSLAAWVAVDQRAPSSFYLASESRISFENGKPSFDTAQKLFASTQYPDLFGYCGWIDFPFSVLESALKRIDGQQLFSQNDNAQARHDKFVAFLKDPSVSHLLNKQFTILHAAREGEGMKATFVFWSVSWSQERGWLSEPLSLPTESALVFSAGSGGKVIREHNDKWRHLLPRTSRSVFSAFCDAVRGGEDPNSGGAPQLVGLFRKGPGRYFGIVDEGKRYFCGKEVPDMEFYDRYEWRNAFFERCDFRTLARLPIAQRQPRPREL